MIGYNALLVIDYALLRGIVGQPWMKVVWGEEADLWCPMKATIEG